MHPTIARVGAVASYGVAASYFASAVFAVAMPPELQRPFGISPHEFWMTLSRQPTAHLCFHGAWIAVGLFGLGAVPAISLLVWRRHPGAILWSGVAALIGFATCARSHLMEVAWDLRIIPVYPGAEPAFQRAVHVVAGLALDVPFGVLTYGAIGVWVLVVSALVLRVERLPPAFAYLGVATGLALASGVAAYSMQVRPLLVLSVGVGGFLLIPAWFAWAGVLLGSAELTAGEAETLLS